MDIVTFIKIANVIILLGNLALMIENMRALKRGEQIIDDAERYRAKCAAELARAKLAANSSGFVKCDKM